MIYSIAHISYCNNVWHILDDDVLMIACGRHVPSVNYYRIRQHINGVPYVKDLFNHMASKANEWLIYTVADCCLSPQFYDHIKQSKSDMVLFKSTVVEGDSDIFLQDNVPGQYCGVAIKTQYYNDIKLQIPNLLIDRSTWIEEIGQICVNNKDKFEINTIDIIQKQLKQYSDNAFRYNQNLCGNYNIDDAKLFTIIMSHQPHNDKQLLDNTLDNLKYQDIDSEIIVMDSTETIGTFNEHIDQKACLYNRALKSLSGNNIVLFLDGGVICNQSNWLSKIWYKLHNRNCILQPFKYSDCGGNKFVSLSAHANNVRDMDNIDFGSCFASWSDNFDQCFNVYATLGEFDYLTAMEYFGFYYRWMDKITHTYFKAWPHYHNLIRNMRQIDVSYVDSMIVKSKVCDDFYRMRLNMLKLNETIQHVHRFKNGFMEWVELSFKDKLMNII